MLSPAEDLIRQADGDLAGPETQFNLQLATRARHAVDWLADNSLIDQAEADRFFADHPDPAVP